MYNVISLDIAMTIEFLNLLQRTTETFMKLMMIEEPETELTDNGKNIRTPGES